MRPVTSLILISLLTLSACQALTPSDVRKASPRSPVKPTESPRASTAPSAQPLALLQKPKEATQTVTGQVAVDASYMVQVGAGQIISNDGASLIATAQLLGQDGAGIISGGAGNIISNDGASVIGQDGAGIISGGAGNFRLAAADAPPLGRILPAGGFRLHVYSMSDGKPISLGVDAAGKPVYTILTNAQGAYTLYLPAALADNVRIAAEVPGHPDRRLDYSMIAAPTLQGQPTLDEDTALVNQYIRMVFLGRLEDLLTRPDSEAQVQERISRVQPALHEQYRVIAKRFQEATDKKGIKDFTPADRQALIQQVADSILSTLDLAIVPINKTGSTVLALPELAQMLKATRERITEVMNEQRSQGVDPTAFFAEQEIIKQHNQQGQPPLYVIKKPSDFNDFIVRAYFATIAYDGGKAAIEIKGFAAVPPLNIDPNAIDRIQSAGGGIIARVGQAVYFSDPDDADSPVGRALAVIEAYQPIGSRP